MTISTIAAIASTLVAAMTFISTGSDAEAQGFRGPGVRAPATGGIGPASGGNTIVRPRAPAPVGVAPMPEPRRPIVVPRECKHPCGGTGGKSEGNRPKPR